MVNMPDWIRASVSISPSTVTAFRNRMANEYPEVTDISQAPLALLIRFNMLIMSGHTVDEAKRALKPLPRGHNKRDHIVV